MYYIYMLNVIQLFENMGIISARVDPETKKKMDRYKQINWSREIRQFVQGRIEQEEKRERISRMSRRLSNLPKTETGFSAKSVREDRDS
jgi:hypothetical protein